MLRKQFPVYSSGVQPDVGHAVVAETCSCDIQINVVYLTDYLPSLWLLHKGDATP